MMNAEAVMQMIKDSFEPEPEVYEVAMYAMSTLAVNDAVMRGFMSKSTEIRGIPPESFHIMKRFDNGLTLNKFWLENYAPIKSQLTMDDIKLNSMRHYITYGEKSKNENAFSQARAILMSRYDVLTMIAFLYKGIKFAEDFDVSLRLGVQLTPDHVNYFKDKGI